MKKAEGGLAADIATLAGAWGTAKRLFDFRKADEALGSQLPSAGIRKAVLIFLAAGVLSTIISFAAYVELAYFSAFTLKTLAEYVGSAIEPQPDFSGAVPFALFLLIWLPFAFILALAQEGAVYYGLKLTGGKGTLAGQYYLSSFVALSMAMASGLALLGPVPCVGGLALLAYVVAVIYFVFAVRCRAYARLHDLHYLHVALVVLAAGGLALLVGSATGSALGSALNIPQAAAYDLANLTNVSGV